MTNSSPQDPQNPTPERRRRPVGGVTFDEMIGIIVAFSTIGAILFWSLGGKKGEFANNFGLGNGVNLLSDNQTFGNSIGIGTIDEVNLGEAESERRELIARSPESELPLAFTPATQKLEGITQIEPKVYELDSGRKLVPLAGVATLSRLQTERPENLNRNTNIIPNKTATTDQKDLSTPKAEVDTTKKADIPATVPNQTEMPDDIAPTYWAYPFVKPMSDQAMVPELADDNNFEPDKLITRATMATLISQAFESQGQTENIKRFKDVTNKNALAADIDQAVRLGFMQGYSEDEFRPLENIPRYQVLVALATGLDLQPTQDVDQTLNKLEGGSDLPDWAREQVAAAAESELIIKRPDSGSNALLPNESATRGEVAAMIHQALVKSGKLEPIESEYILKP